MKPPKVPTPPPVAARPPAPRGPRYRYSSQPPATVTLKLGDIAAQIPPDARASLFDVDRVVEVPAADLFAGPVPRLSLARLAEIAPDCVLKPKEDTKIKVPAGRLSQGYQMLETSELIDEPAPIAEPEPMPAEPAPVVEDKFSPAPLPFAPPAEVAAAPAPLPIPAPAPLPTFPAPASLAPEPPASFPPAPEPIPVQIPAPLPRAVIPAPVAKDIDRPPGPVPYVPEPVPVAPQPLPVFPPAAAAPEPVEEPPIVVPAPLPVAQEIEPPAPEPVVAPPPTTFPPPPTPRVTALPQERKPRPFFPMFRRKDPTEPAKVAPVESAPAPAPAVPVPMPPPIEGPKSTGRIEIPKPRSTFFPRPRSIESRVEPPAPIVPEAAPEPVIAPPAAEIFPESVFEPAPEAIVAPVEDVQTEAVFVETEHLPREEEAPRAEIPEQDSLQAVFMTEEYLSVDRVVELCGGLPGVKSCVLSRGAGVVASHHVPESFDLVSLSAHALEMLGAMRASAAKMGVGAVPAVTIHSEKGPITFFQQEDLCLLVLHKDRGFVPGVREKLQRVIEELSRANLPLPVGQPRPQIKPF